MKIATIWFNFAGKYKMLFKRFLVVLISNGILLISTNSNALTWGQIFSGAGEVGSSWNKEEQRQLEKRRLELEVQRMNREAEIQKLEYQKKMQRLQQNESKNGYDLYAVQKELANKLPIAVDADTWLISAIPFNNKIFQFGYKLVNHTLGDLNADLLKNNLKANLQTSICSDEYWGGFVRSGGHVIYHYVDKNNVFVSRVQISNC